MRFLSKIRVNPDSLVDGLGMLAIGLTVGLGLWIAFGLGMLSGVDQLVGAEGP